VQTELQQIRNSQPELLENPEAQQQIQQLMQADEVLQQRKAAVAQLALVLELSKDLEAAQASLDAPPGPEAAAAALLNDPEQLAQMLGIDDDESEH
jgi:predicted component of type VI protein secretion system